MGKSPFCCCDFAVFRRFWKPKTKKKGVFYPLTLEFRFLKKLQVSVIFCRAQKLFFSWIALKNILKFFWHFLKVVFVWAYTILPIFRLTHIIRKYLEIWVYIDDISILRYHPTLDIDNISISKYCSLLDIDKISASIHHKVYQKGPGV